MQFTQQTSLELVVNGQLPSVKLKIIVHLKQQQQCQKQIAQ